MGPEDETSAKAEIDSGIVEALGFEPMDGGGRRRGSITDQISDAGFAITDVLDPKADAERPSRNGSVNGTDELGRTKRSRRHRRNKPGSGPAVPASTEDDEVEAELLRREGLVEDVAVTVAVDGSGNRSDTVLEEASVEGSGNGSDTVLEEASVEGSGNGSDTVPEEASVDASGNGSDTMLEEVVVDSGNGSGLDGEHRHDSGVVVVDAEFFDGDSAENGAKQPTQDGANSNDGRSDTRLHSTDRGEQVEGSVDVDGDDPANATVEMSAVESAMVTPTHVDRSGDGIVVDDPVGRPRHVDPVPSSPPQAPAAEAPAPVVAEAPRPVVAESPPIMETPASPAITGPHPVVRINEADSQRGVVGTSPSLGDLFGGLPGRRRRLEARKVRRVVRHIDPWSVLTFSVLFHLCLFAALLLASVLVWNVAEEAGTIENLENFILELGDYETFEIDGDAIFRAALAIAGIFTLAASVLMVLLTVMFNLLSDLIGGIRVTVIEEETIRVRPKDGYEG